MPNKKDAKTTATPEIVRPQTSVDPKIAGVLCWIFTPVASLIFMLIEDLKKDEGIQFDAKQSLVFGIVNILLPLVCIPFMIIPFINIIAVMGVAVVNMAAFCIRIAMAVNCYNGKRVELPLIGEWAKKI